MTDYDNCIISARTTGCSGGEKPNGVALAPNQQKLYVTDFGRKNIRV